MPESFPNARNALLEAFDQSNPVPKLLGLVKAHPDLSTITDLILVYHQLTTDRPTEIESFAKVLVKLRDSDEVTVAAPDEYGNPEQLEIGDVLDRELAERHGNDLVMVDSSSVTPSNDYLISSLLSAMSLKYRLTDSPAQAGSIHQGLHYKDEKYDDPPETFEILILGACLQLLITGSYLYGPEGTDVGKDDVPAALEAVRADNVVKNPNGQKLLDATLEHAKSGFKNDLDTKAAWSILFP